MALRRNGLPRRCGLDEPCPIYTLIYTVIFWLPSPGLESCRSDTMRCYDYSATAGQTRSALRFLAQTSGIGLLSPQESASPSLKLQTLIRR